MWYVRSKPVTKYVKLVQEMRYHHDVQENDILTILKRVQLALIQHAYVLYVCFLRLAPESISQKY
jgi:hypothetical protein